MRFSSIFPCIATLLIHVIMFAVSFRPSILSSIHSRSPVSLSRRKGSTVRMSLGSSNIRSVRFTQVVSDVDDTLKSSGGVNVGGVALGGIDVQYERGDFYPGVGEFMLELSRYGLPEDSANYPAKIAILTARAEEFKAALEIKDESKLAVALRSAGEKAGIEGWGVSRTTRFSCDAVGTLFRLIQSLTLSTFVYVFAIPCLETQKIGWSCAVWECRRMDRPGSERSSKIHEF